MFKRFKKIEIFGVGILVAALLFCTMALGPVDSILVRPNKGTVITLNSAISESVTAANCTAVDLKTFDSGMLEIVLISGTSGISVQPQVYSAATGTYVTPNTFAPGGVTGANTWTAYPACTVTTASKSFLLTGLKGRYWKFVPTLTGATSCTIKFTPCP